MAIRFQFLSAGNLVMKTEGPTQMQAAPITAGDGPLQRSLGLTASGTQFCSSALLG